jgi:hypothetical protein
VSDETKPRATWLWGWPAGVGHKQVGICFDGSDSPLVVMTLTTDQLAQLDEAVFGEARQLKGKIATLTAERDRLRAERDEARMVLAAARDADDWDPGAMVMLYDSAIDERDGLAARLAQAERVVEVMIGLVALKDGPRDEFYYRTRDTAWQDARDALAAMRALPRKRVAVDALDGTAGPGEEGGT